MQNHNRIRKKFNLEAFVFLSKASEKSVVFPIEFLANFTIFKVQRAVSRSDLIGCLLCKIIANSVRSSIENNWLANLPR